MSDRLGTRRPIATALSLSLFLGVALLLLIGGSTGPSPVGAAIQWFPGPSLAVARSRQTATLLQNGRLLIAGGNTSTSEVLDPATGRWSSPRFLSTSRSYHTATRLKDGRVLVAGGLAAVALASTEIYDPATDTWTATGSLATPRARHVAALLPDGRVLVAGGDSSANLTAALSSTEIWDPATGTWTPSAVMSSPRIAAAAAALRGGQVLVSGGIRTVGQPYTSAELYDPASGTWSATGSMNDQRLAFTLTRLDDGRVLAAGGDSPSAEVYNPITGTWQRTGDMSTFRQSHAATLLGDGRVLVAGGFTSAQSNAQTTASTEVWDPMTGSWSGAGDLSQPRRGLSLTTLPNGLAVASGGANDQNPNGVTTTDYFGEPFAAATATATGTATRTPTVTPTYTATPHGTPASFVFLPFLGKARVGGW